jgi:hypothetical protein
MNMKRKVGVKDKMEIKLWMSHLREVVNRYIDEPGSFIDGGEALEAELNMTLHRMELIRHTIERGYDPKDFLIMPEGGFDEPK